MRRIQDINEVHHILLGIATAFHQICTKHDIPYCMLGGTMLGAVRHKGFIPWDDDMDFAVPREHYEELATLLEKELPQDYRCLTYSNCEQIKYPFIKIEDRRTCIDDKSLDCPLEEKIGLNIDVFPLDRCDKNSWRMKRVFFYIALQTLFFLESPTYSKPKALIKKLCQKLAPKERLYFVKKLENAMLHAGDANHIGNLIGRWREKETFKANIYQNLADYPFEHIALRGPKDYNTYLTQMYGDYMQLPPKEQQLVHVEGVYWRDMGGAHLAQAISISRKDHHGLGM